MNEILELKEGMEKALGREIKPGENVAAAIKELINAHIELKKQYAETGSKLRKGKAKIQEQGQKLVELYNELQHRN